MSRKYGHSGYMDSDRDSRDRDAPSRKKPPPRSKPLTPEDKAQRRGVRHAMDRDAQEVVRCPTCGANVRSQSQIEIEMRCPKCRAALHCCRACQQFDSAARWECRSAIEERIPDKLDANRCGLFQARRVLDATGKRVEVKASNDPRSRFEDLFR